MDNLAKNTTIGSAQLIVGLGTLLFVPAWTFDFWQAWIYLLISGTAIVLVFFYLYKNDSRLLERRLNRHEKEKNQKWIQLYIIITYVAVFALPAVDHHFLWSKVQVSVVIAGDILVVLGYFIIFMALKANSFAGSTIEVTTDQKVISTGPYAIVRHPMYSGGIVMLMGTPLALGSWWGLLSLIPITLLIVWRLLEEEKLLSQNLSGYKEYCQKIPCRLVPFMW